MTALITHDLVNGVPVPKCTWAHTITNPFRERFWEPEDLGSAVLEASTIWKRRPSRLADFLALPATAKVTVNIILLILDDSFR